MKNKFSLIRRAAIARASALAVSFAFFSVAAQAGVVLSAPAVLYDAPSTKAEPLWILDAGYPLRQLSAVDGWRKISTFSGENGWVQERNVRDARAGQTVEEAVARSGPEESAAPAFRIQQGVILEVLNENGGWLQVSHRDGDTGFIPASVMWIND